MVSQAVLRITNYTATQSSTFVRTFHSLYHRNERRDNSNSFTEISLAFNIYNTYNTYVDKHIEMRNVVYEGSHINPLVSRETMARDMRKWRHFADEGLCQLSMWSLMTLQFGFVVKLLIFFIFQNIHYSSIWYAVLQMTSYSLNDTKIMNKTFVSTNL